MRKIWFSSISILLLIFCQTSWGATAASKSEVKQEDLKHLDQKIHKLQNEIANDKGKKGQLSQQLKSNTAKLDRLKNHLNHLKADLNKQQTALNQLKKQQQDENQQISAQQSALAQQLLATYKLYRSADGHNETTKLLSYCQCLDNTKMADIDRLQHALYLVNSQQHQTIHHKIVIQSTLTKQQKSQQQLALAEQGQQHALTQLDTCIESKNAQLNQLLANRRALDHLFNKLQQAQQKNAAPPPPSIVEHHPRVAVAPVPVGVLFVQLQGRLPWPLVGSVAHHFGDAIGQTGLKYTGILIRGHAGQTVHAVASGQVVFANWLQGFGLLLIIDHGNGYMSLYGHNQVLYRKVGDRVQAHDQVANVAQGCQQEITGLYFEIRHNSQPLNPIEWLSSGSR